MNLGIFFSSDNYLGFCGQEQHIRGARVVERSSHNSKGVHVHSKSKKVTNDDRKDKVNDKDKQMVTGKTKAKKNDDRKDKDK